MSQPVPLSQMYADIIAKMRETDATDASDRMYPVTKTGFFKLISSKGTDLGLAFYCPRCRTSACGLDEETAAVFHCGKVTRFPKGLFGFIAKFGLRRYTLERTWF